MTPPLQNRVTPFGEIIAVAARGTMMGNRGGALHDAARRLGARRWVSRRWICCRLDFKDRRREVMAPGRYTELFFLDEATALAAGHRPCAECRREDYRLFQAAWLRAGLPGPARADNMDRFLHRERFEAHVVGDLPDGAMVACGDDAFLVRAGRFHLWSSSGYGAARDISVPERLLTPPATVRVLAAGYRAGIHPSLD
jgi:hypothetical protein